MNKESNENVEHQKELLNLLQEQNQNNKFGFYDIYIELDTKYRDRTNIEKNNSEYVFKISGRKDVNAGIKNGIIGINNPVHNIVQLEIGDILMPNVLNTYSTYNRVSMVIHELLGNDVTIKTTTNITDRTERHFIFDIMPIYNLPNYDPNNMQQSMDVLVDSKHIRLVPIVRTLLFKSPTTEVLDQLTISFYYNNEKVVFPNDEFNCTIKLGPYFKNELIFQNNHNLNVNEQFEIINKIRNDDFENDLKNNSSFTVFDNNNKYEYSASSVNELKIFDPLNTNSDKFISFKPNYNMYKNILEDKFYINFIKDSKSINFLINDNYYLLKSIDTDIQKYLLKSIIQSINEYNEYTSAYNSVITENSSILTKIDTNKSLMNQATNELNIALENLFTLTSNNLNNLSSSLTYDITISSDIILFNNISSKSKNIYYGNTYILNQSDNSNMLNDAINTLKDETLFLSKTVDQHINKLSFNDTIQDDFNLIQGGSYTIDYTNTSLENTSLIIIPSDVFNYSSTFIFPIEYYFSNNNLNNSFKNFNENNGYYLEQFYSNSSTFKVEVPELSFSTTQYNMPFMKYRGYDFNYDCTGTIDNSTTPPTITNVKRDSIVDVALSPFSIYNDHNSSLNNLIFDMTTDVIISNTSTYYSFDGIQLYDDTEEFDSSIVPKSSTSPCIIFKWGYIYKLHFTNVIAKNVKYIIFEMLASESFTDDKNTRTFSNYLIDPSLDPLSQPQDTSINFIEFVNNNKCYYKFDISKLSIFYIDLRELLQKNTTTQNITPNKYDKDYMFGKTFKIYYTDDDNNIVNENYALFKLGSLINVNSYYLNYYIKTDDANPIVNKLQFNSIVKHIDIKYESKSSLKDNKKYFVIYKNYALELYYLVVELLPDNIVYKKVNCNIDLNINTDLILDLNYYSNAINGFFNVKFNIDDNSLKVVDSKGIELMIPAMNSNNVSSNQLNNTLYTLGNITDDIYDDTTIIIEKVIDINVSINENIGSEYILKYNTDNGATFNLSFGRRYKINFTDITDIDSINFVKSDFSVIVVIKNEMIDIKNINRDSAVISGVSGLDDFIQHYNFIYNDTLKAYVIQMYLLDGYTQYIDINLINQYININFEELEMVMYLQHNVTNVKHNSVITTINMKNYNTTIKLYNIKDEITKYDSIYKPNIELYYTDNNNNNPSSINNSITITYDNNIKTIYNTGYDNYNDFTSDTIKNVYMLEVNNVIIKDNLYNTEFRLKKVTGCDRILSNEFVNYRSNIDLYYSFIYYLDITKFVANLYLNDIEIYEAILETNDIHIELYLKEDLSEKYTNSDIEKIKYVISDDNYNYFNGVLPASLPYTKYKINVTNNLPSILYYGISFMYNNTKYYIKGGEIKLHNINVSYPNKIFIGNGNNSLTTLIFYNVSNRLIEDKTYFLNINNTYRDYIELYAKTPDRDKYDHYLRLSDLYKDDIYNYSYRELQDNITQLNNELYNNVKGFTNTNITLTSSITDIENSQASITITNGNTKYTDTNIYLISNYTYNVESNDDSTLNLTGAKPPYLGNIVIISSNGVIDLTSIINVTTTDVSYILTKNTFKITKHQNVTIKFNITVTDYVSKLDDYLLIYFENHSTQKGKIYLNGTVNGNITTKAKEQEDYINTLKSNRELSSNQIEVLETHKLLENINNIHLQVKMTENNTVLNKTIKKYKDLESEKNKILFELDNIKKLISNKIQYLTDILPNYYDIFYKYHINDLYSIYNEITNNDNVDYVNHTLINKILYNIYLNNNNNTYFGVFYNYSFNVNIDFNSHNISINRNNLYIFKFYINAAHNYNENINTVITTISTKLKLYRKVNIDNITYYKELTIGYKDEYIYINDDNVIFLYIPLLCRLDEIYIGLSDNIVTINNTEYINVNDTLYNHSKFIFNKINIQYSSYDKININSSKINITSKNNKFILDEYYNNVQKLSLVQLNNNSYTINDFINHLEETLNKVSKFNYVYSVNKDMILSINTKIYNYIYVNFDSSNNYLIVNDIDYEISNYSNKDINLKYGNKYVIDYTELDIDINVYIDDEEILNRNCINDKNNKKIYLTVNLDTPTVLFIGNQTYYFNVFIDNYDNIYQVIYNETDNIFKIDINYMTYNDTYVFDYNTLPDNYIFKLYKDNNLTEELINNVTNDTINKKYIVTIKSEDNINQLYCGNSDIGVNSNMITIQNSNILNNYGMKIRFDSDNIYKNLISNNEMNIYNNLKSLYDGDILSNANVTIKRITKIIDNYSLILYINSGLYATVKQDDNVLFNKSILITSIISSNINIIYITKLTANNYLISYDDNNFSYFYIINIDTISFNITKLKVTANDTVLINNNNYCRVSNDLLKSYEPMCIIQDDIYHCFIINIDNDKNYISRMYYNVNTELLELSSDIYSLTLNFDNVSSVINVNNYLIYTLKLNNDSYLYSMGLIKIQSNWGIYNNAFIKIDNYTSVNNNCAIFKFGSNSFIWAGKNLQSTKTTFKIYEINTNEFIQKYPNPNILENDIILLKARNTNSCVSSVYGYTIPNTNKIILIHFNSDKNDISNYNVIVKTIDIIINVNTYYEYNILTELKLKNITDTKYDLLYGYHNNDTYIYPISIHYYENYNKLCIEINSLLLSDERDKYTIFQYNVIENILDTDAFNYTNEYNKFYFGSNKDDNISSYNYLKLWKSKYELSLSTYIINENYSIDSNLNSKVSDIKNELYVLNIKYLDIYNKYQDIEQKQNNIGYSNNGTYQHLYRNIINNNNILTTLLNESNVNFNNIFNNQRSISNSSSNDTQIREAENTYQSLIASLVYTNNQLDTYKQTLNDLLLKIKNTNSTIKNYNVAYYANKYINIDTSVNTLNSLINEKHSAINSYNIENTQLNLSYYNNLSKISEFTSHINIKNTIINDSLINSISNIYNLSKLSNNVEQIYLQNITIKNRSIYIPSRRFKIPLTFRIVNKDSITNYIKM